MLWYNGLVLHPCFCVLVPVSYDMGWNPSGRDGDELVNVGARVLDRCGIGDLGGGTTKLKLSHSGYMVVPRSGAIVLLRSWTKSSRIHCDGNSQCKACKSNLTSYSERSILSKQLPR